MNTPRPGAAPDDYAWLAARVMRPGVPRRGEALAAVAGASDPREAWEVLAARGLIPLAWVGDPDRRFEAPGRATVDADAAVPLRITSDGGATWDVVEADPARQVLRFERPVTVAQAVTLAADADGVARAEALAREVLGRLRPWDGGGDARRVVWAVAEAPEDALGAETFRALDGPRLALARAIGSASGLARTTDEAYEAMMTFRRAAVAMPAALLDAVGATIEAHVNWRAATARGLRARDGVDFAALDDPFAPALDLWATGYGLAAITPSAAVLAALVVRG